MQHNARGIIERQLRQMVHLVDDLLDVGRITQGKVELRREPADVAAVGAGGDRDEPPADRQPAATNSRCGWRRRAR